MGPVSRGFSHRVRGRYRGCGAQSGAAKCAVWMLEWEAVRGLVGSGVPCAAHARVLLISGRTDAYARF